ncbi:MAG: RNA-binding protein [Pyrinomonas sp.]|uniref:CRTAC1 family protein n=1 Tax=Pyrinomonas sp. TaxID=2080306 RepID=UPI003329925D
MALRSIVHCFCSMALLANALGASAQTPPADQTRTGRSYAAGEPLRRPSAPVPQAPSPVQFADITAQSRIDFRHMASPTSQKYLLETMGGGVALLDYDGDGRMDIFFTNGAALQDPMPRGAMPDKREARYWNRLYRQRPDGTFEDVTERAGLRGDGYSMGVAVGDYDNDGDPDLLVTGYERTALYRNNGDGTFTDVTKQVGINAPGWSTSAAWLDYDRDGRLDLFIARYMEWDFERGAIYCGEPRPGYRAYCHPDNFKGASNLLFHQKTDGTFEDVSATSKISVAIGKGLGVAVADFDNDGWPDIFVANDSVPQTLFRNRGDGTFEDIGLISGAGYDENGKTFAGMGIDAADYDNDGLIDVFITTLSNETYALFRNAGDLSFVYMTNMTNVGPITMLYSGWGTRFADFDNDGWRDLFVAQSHVLDTIEKTSSYLTYRQSPLLMRNVKGRFVNVSASAGDAFNRRYAARGAAFGDLDDDGDVDVVMVVLDGAPVVLRNQGTKNRWVGLRLIGTRSNRDASGARVVVTDSAGTRQTFDVSTAGSYLSANDGRLLVGLGENALQSVEISWPSGRVQRVEGLTINRYNTITER